MKKLIFMLVLVYPLISFGQINHELKSDLFLTLNKDWNLSYEMMPAKTLGFQLDIMFDRSNHQLDTAAFNDPSTSTFLTSNLDFLQFRFATKYYPFQEQSADGLFLGGYLIYETEFNEDKEFKAFLNERYNIPTDKFSRTGLGLNIGYKWFFGGDAWFMEPEIAHDWLLNTDAPEEYFDSLNGQLSFFFRIGYRFRKGN